MWEGELAIRHNGCPISDTCASYPEIKLENVSRVRVADGIAKRLLRVDGENDAIAVFAESFRDHEATVTLDKVSDVGSVQTYFVAQIAYTSGNPSILSMMDRSGCFQSSNVIVRHGIERWTVLTGQKESLRDLVGRLEARNYNVELKRKVDVGPIDAGDGIQSGILQKELTPKQLAAFESALAVGYYDVENRATVEDVADRLGVHRSTAGEHIKRAESALMSALGKRLFSSGPRSS